MKEQDTCFCNQTSASDRFLIDCDHCHKWFHGDCVSIEKSSVPTQWFCETCQVFLKLEEKLRLSLPPALSAENVQLKTAQRLLYDQLMERSMTSSDPSSFLCLCTFYLGTWKNRNKSEDRFEREFFDCLYQQSKPLLG